MQRGRGRPPGALLLRLALLALLARPGRGNEGSVAGGCLCKRRIDSSPDVKHMEHFRKHLKGYTRCPLYVRFQLLRQSVCGSRQEPWVRVLTSCWDRRECGYDYLKNLAHNEHLPTPDVLIPGLTKKEPSDTRTPAHKYWLPTMPSTQQPTLSSQALSSDKGLSEAGTPTVSHSVGAEPETGDNQRQLEKKAGVAAAGTSSLVPVLSLLAIVFLLTGILLYIFCKRRPEQPLQYSSGVHFYYTPATPNSNA